MSLSLSFFDDDGDEQKALYSPASACTLPSSFIIHYHHQFHFSFMKLPFPKKALQKEIKYYTRLNHPFFDKEITLMSSSYSKKITTWLEKEEKTTAFFLQFAKRNIECLPSIKFAALTNVFIA